MKAKLRILLVCVLSIVFTCQSMAFAFDWKVGEGKRVDQDNISWSLEGNQCQMKDLCFTIPRIFDVLYEKLSNDTTVAFYPESTDTKATLRIKIETTSVSYEEFRNALPKLTSYFIGLFTSPSVEYAKTKEEEHIIAHNIKLSYPQHEGNGYYYAGILYKSTSDYLYLVNISVDADDDGLFNYDKAFTDLIDSAFKNPVINIAFTESKTEEEKKTKQEVVSEKDVSSVSEEDNKSENLSKKPNFGSLLSLARQLAELISYIDSEPASGMTETVKVGNKSVLVHSEFKYAMDVYYEYYKQYYDSVKKMNFMKMMSLADQAVLVDKALEGIEDIDVSEGDMAYYLEVYQKILKLMTEME